MISDYPGVENMRIVFDECGWLYAHIQVFVITVSIIGSECNHCKYQRSSRVNTSLEILVHNAKCKLTLLHVNSILSDLLITTPSSHHSHRGQHYVPRFLCSPVPMFPEPMFTGTYVPRYLCSPVPMFPDFCTLIVDFSINR